MYLDKVFTKYNLISGYLCIYLRVFVASIMTSGAASIDRERAAIGENWLRCFRTFLSLQLPFILSKIVYVDFGILYKIIVHRILIVI